MADTGGEISTLSQAQREDDALFLLATLAIELRELGVTVEEACQQVQAAYAVFDMELVERC